METKIVLSTHSHLSSISLCHIKCFSKSLSSELGINFVNVMLSWYLSSNKVFLFHLENTEGHCLGYCGGIISDGTLGTGSASGMAQHTFKAAIFAFLTHPWLIFHKEVRSKWPVFWKNILMKIGFTSKNHFSEDQVQKMKKNPTVGLVVIGVDPLCQGKGYGSLLLKEFERIAVTQFLIYDLQLSVRIDNLTAISLYKKNGWCIGEEKEGSLSMLKIINPVY